MAIGDEPKPRLPFKGNLEPADFGSNPPIENKKFHQLDSNPNKIIRPMFALSHEDLEDVKIFKGIIETLKTHGIDIPKFDLFVAEGRSRVPEMTASVEKVQGIRLNELITNARSVAEKSLAKKLTEDLYIKLTEYLIATEEFNTTYMYDIYKPGDYVYGKVKGDTEDKLYLVDIEPVFHQAWKGAYDYFNNEDEAFHYNDRARQDNLDPRLYYTAQMILMAEKNLGVTFMKLRQNLKNIKKINPYNQAVQRILDELDHKE